MTIALPPPNYEQTIEAIVQCEIPRANVRITYVDYLQSDEVTISNLGSLNDDKLRCLRAAVHPSYILTIENEVQQAAFYQFSKRNDRPKQRAEAREWVRSKGLLDRLQTVDLEHGIKEFAAALEIACDLKPGSALTLYGASSLIIRSDFLLDDKSENSANAVYCLMQMFYASDAVENGKSLGFIGNVAFEMENKK